MSIATRFAPSPSGLLHIGNARTALVNWLFARAHDGRFILRLDDTDAPRSRDDFAAAIEEDLRWLGLDWAEGDRQSERLERYEAAFATLADAGRVYACYETPDELEAKRKAQRARGRPPIYDRAGRRLTGAERSAFEAGGRVPHWRFALDDREVVWRDLIQGDKRFLGARLSDPVVRRADGRPTYTFASAVDDVELGITHVIRGEDHVTNTAVQIQIIEALSGPVPTFAHLPLLVDADGKSLSKRLGSLSLQALREQGLEPMAINAVLATLGTGDAPRPAFCPQDLATDFALEKFGRAPPRFEPKVLERLNADLLHAMPFEVAAPRLEALGMTGADEHFWLAVRPNLERFADAVHWWAVCHAALAPVIEEPEYLRAAAELLPEGELDEDAFAAWTDALRQHTGRRGKALFRPLRLAITAREHGPALAHLLPIIGRERVRARLCGEPA